MFELLKSWFSVLLSLNIIFLGTQDCTYSYIYMLTSKCTFVALDLSASSVFLLGCLKGSSKLAYQNQTQFQCLTHYLELF